MKLLFPEHIKVYLFGLEIGSPNRDIYEGDRIELKDWDFIPPFNLNPNLTLRLVEFDVKEF